MTIRNKISLSFSASLLLMASIVFSLLFYFSSKVVNNLVYDHLEDTAQSYSKHIETYLNQNIERLKLVTSRTKLRQTLFHHNQNPNDEDIKTINDIITDAAQSVSEFERICVLDLNGKIVTSTNKDFTGKEYHDKEFFIKGKQENYIFFMEEDGVNKIFVAGPFTYQDQLIGVGIAVVKTDVLNGILANHIGLGQTGEVLIAIPGQSDIPLFISPRRFPDIQQDQKEKLAEPMRQALQGSEDFFKGTLDYRGEKVLAVSRYIETGNLGLVAKIDQAEAYQPIYYLIFIIAVVVFGAIAIFFVISLLISKVITNPIEELSTAIRENRKSGVSSKDEIGQLSNEFNQMLDTMASSYRQVDQKVKAQTKEIVTQQRDLEDQQKALVNLLEDSDKEKKLIQAQAQELAKFKLAVDNTNDHVAITDAEGTALYMNKAAEGITGFTAAEVLGKKVGTKDLWGGLMEKSFYQKLWKTIKTDKRSFVGEINNKRKNGQNYTAKISISPILDNKNKVIFFVVIERDITHEKEVDRMKTEFISLASHQLRTPLSAMKWFLEMLIKGDVGKLSKEQLEMVQNIDQSNQRMIDLVNALLNISRIESGRIIIEPKLTNLNDLCKSILIELESRIKEKQIKLISACDAKLPKINIDPKLITEVYKNLLTNAIKYTPVKGSIKISLFRRGQNIAVSIADTGVGIPKQEQNKVFAKFFRATNVVKMETDGTGLGLYLAKAIIDASGGTINFKSVPDKGTIFTFTLPLSGSPAQKGEVSIDSGVITPDNASRKEKEKPPTKNKKINNKINKK